MACLLLLISLTNLQNVVLAQDPDLTINGGWSPWSTVATPCMRPNARGRLEEVFCGGGMKTRKRSCTNPVPQVSLLTNSKYFINRVKSCSTGYFRASAASQNCLLFEDVHPDDSTLWNKDDHILSFHIVASISVEWKRVVKRFLINWMQWEIYRVVFGAIPLIVSHKMHYLVLWLRTIGANWNNKKPLPYVLATLILIMRGSAQFYPQFLMHQNHFYSTRLVLTLQAHLGLLFSNIKFSNAQVMRRASFGQLQPLFPFLLGYPFFRTFFKSDLHILGNSTQILRRRTREKRRMQHHTLWYEVVSMVKLQFGVRHWKPHSDHFVCGKKERSGFSLQRNRFARPSLRTHARM